MAKWFRKEKKTSDIDESIIGEEQEILEEAEESETDEDSLQDDSEVESIDPISTVEEDRSDFEEPEDTESDEESEVAVKDEDKLASTPENSSSDLIENQSRQEITATPVEEIAETEFAPTSEPEEVAYEESENEYDEEDSELLDDEFEVSNEQILLTIEPLVIEELSILKKGRKTQSREQDEKKKAAIIDSVFKKNGVKAKVSRWSVGPRIVRFNIKVSAFEKYESVLRLRKSFQLALGEKHVAISDHSKGKKSITLDVQRQIPDIISLRDVLETKESLQNHSNLVVGIGKTESGFPVLVDLHQTSNLLIGGNPNSGKKTILENVICSLALRGNPSETRVIILDTPDMHLAEFSELPHLLMPIVSDEKRAIEALIWLSNEMQFRFDLLDRNRLESVASYNSQLLSDEKPLPEIVVVISELNELFELQREIAENAVLRIAEQGAAVGIHVIAATEFPSKTTIVPIIRSNMQVLVALNTSDKEQSESIIGKSGAESLFGEGDGLIVYQNSPATNFQTSYIDEEEIQLLVSTLADKFDTESMDFLVHESPISIFGADYFKKSIDDVEDLLTINKESEKQIPESEFRKIVSLSLGEGLDAKDLMEFEEFSEPDWREIFDLLERRIEPCDLTGVMVQVSRKRKLWRSIERALAHVKVQVTKRLHDRSVFRHEVKLAQDEAINEALSDLETYRNSQGQSIAWKFHEAAYLEMQKAATERENAIEFVRTRATYKNIHAEQTYRDFVKRLLINPILVAYIYSVVVLTGNRFDWLLHALPVFNLNNFELFLLFASFLAFAWIRAGWKYARSVAKVQTAFVKERKEYEDKKLMIDHAFEEMVRLEQQFAHIKPFMEVLARGYRAHWHLSDVSEIDVSTDIDITRLPACFGIARAVEGDDKQMNLLQQYALQRVVSPGWRTSYFELLANKYGEKNGIELDFRKLDSDPGESESGMRSRFHEALNDFEMAKRIGLEKIVDTITSIHTEILRSNLSTSEELRPPVLSTRVNGFENIDSSSQWLQKSESKQQWFDYLSEILGDSPPFSYLSVSGDRLHLGAHTGDVISHAVVPHYLEAEAHESVKLEKNDYLKDIIAPIDVAVRVDVSGWATLEEFGIFERNIQSGESNEVPIIGGGIGV